MKKGCFVLVAIAIYFISCTSSRVSVSTINGEVYSNDPFVKKYKDSVDFLPPNIAIEYIHEFKNHKYHGLKRFPLKNAWSFFSPALLKEVVNDPDVDSITFLLAAFPKKGIKREDRRHPFVIMQALPKISLEARGKGSSNVVMSTSNAVYLKPSNLCPPPNSGCRIPGSE